MAKLKNLIRSQNLNRTVRPQDDFYTFANGGWIAKNVIPNEESAWGTFYLSIRQNQERLRTLVMSLRKKRSSHGAPAQLVRDLWLSGMNVREREVLGFSPIRGYADRIRKAQSVSDLVTLTGEMHRDGIAILWGVGVGPDDKDSSKVVFSIGQDGLSLPDRDFYVKNTVEYKAIRNDFLVHLEKMLKMYGYTEKEARSAARSILSIESKLARASMTMVERRDPHAQYNPHSLSQLKKMSPDIDWKQYLDRIGAKTSRVIVGQPLFFKELNALLKTSALPAWKDYFLWHVILSTSAYLSEEILKAQFVFYGTRLQGTPNMRPLWRRVIATIDAHIGDALGQLYVDAYFPPKAKKRIDALVQNIIETCAERIEELPWMTSTTKKKALKKLYAIRPKIGFPKKWHAYKGLSVSPLDFLGNVVRANRHEHARSMRKIGKKPDPEEWHMSAPTVNAYFHPNLNEIVFPAGILQAPAFDADADDAFNYGGIGAVIGHEITHAFDDEGRKFDSEGNLSDWWVKKDEVEFKKRAEVLRKQYDAFEVLPGHKVNGQLTLGENIADLGGVVIAFEAWKKTKQAKDQKKIGGFTGAQRFFLANAFFESGSIRAEALKKRLVTDPHAPSECRINGPFPHVDAFYEAFEVQKGDALYIAPESRARIW